METKAIKEMYCNMGISEQIYDFSENILKGLKERFEKIDENAEYNQMKVLQAIDRKSVV